MMIQKSFLNHSEFGFYVARPAWQYKFVR